MKGWIMLLMKDIVYQTKIQMLGVEYFSKNFGSGRSENLPHAIQAVAVLFDCIPD